MKVHETTKEIKNNCEVLVTAFAVTLVIITVFFGLGSVMYGVLLFTLAAAFGFFGIVYLIKIHARHTQELLCELQGKKLLDYCECDFCKSARK